MMIVNCNLASELPDSTNSLKIAPLTAVVINAEMHSFIYLNFPKW